MLLIGSSIWKFNAHKKIQRNLNLKKTIVFKHVYNVANLESAIVK